LSDFEGQGLAKARCHERELARLYAKRTAENPDYRKLVATSMGQINAPQERTFFRLPLDRINCLTSSFLCGTLILTVTAVPLYLWYFGLDWFQVVLFFAMLAGCGFSISLGYHRLFSHIAFQAS
jgi:hypothetical protein